MQLHGLTLFPLKLIHGTRLEGYYIDAQGEVYSTRMSAVPKKLLGSKQFSYSRRYYTLAGASYDGASLLRQAKGSPKWAEEMTIAKTIVKRVGQVQLKDRAHAGNVTEGLTFKGWVIAKVAKHKGKEFLQFGSQPAIHMTEASYKAEMTRLATQEPGTRFVALRIEQSLVAGGLQWS